MVSQTMSGEGVMKLLSEDERADQLPQPAILRMVPDMNCGPEGHCARTGVDPDKIIWVGNLKMCPLCPRHPHNQPWQRPLH